MFLRGSDGMPTAAETHEQLELAFTALFNKPCRVEKYRAYRDGAYVCYMVKVKKDEDEKIDVGEIEGELVFKEEKEEMVEPQITKEEVKEGGSEMETNQPQTERITVAQFFGEEPVTEPAVEAAQEPTPQTPVAEEPRGFTLVNLDNRTVREVSVETPPTPVAEEPELTVEVVADPSIGAPKPVEPTPDPEPEPEPLVRKPVTLNKDGTPRKQRSDIGVPRGPRKAKKAKAEKKVKGKRGRPKGSVKTVKGTGARRGRPPKNDKSKPKGKSQKPHVTLNKDGTPRKQRSDKGQTRGPRN